MPALLLLLTLLADVPAVRPPAGGGVIEATIRGTTQPLTVELLVRDEQENWNEIEHQDLSAATRKVKFTGLAPGAYQILVKGREPGERHATKIVVGNSDVRRVNIDVKPIPLTGTITIGGDALGAGGMRIRHREFQWLTTFPVAEDGTLKATLWQGGPFTATIKAAVMPTGFTDVLELGKTPTFRIDIPDARITGVVRDANTGKPVSATVLLTTKAADTENNVRVKTDAAGRFEFHGIKFGTQTLRFINYSHLEPEPVTFELTKAARLRELDVKLDPGRLIPIVVIDAEGDPVEQASVIAAIGPRVTSRAKTDVDGRASIALPAGQAATVFIIAKQAGFGVQRVARERTEGRLRLHMPRSASSLLIRALKTDGGAMPPFSLLMRYNGELVPTDVADELEITLGLRLATGAQSEALLSNIPTGSYEFWPYRTPSEMESIIAAGEFAAPIQVNVRTGENKIAVKFAAR